MGSSGRDASTQVASADLGGWKALCLEAIIITAIIQPHIHTLRLNQTAIPECTHQVTRNKRGMYIPPTNRHSSHSSPRVLSPLAEGLKPTSSVHVAVGERGWFPLDQYAYMWMTGGAFRRHAGRTMGVSRNTSPVWCAACARSPPHARAPFASAGSGPPPSGTKPEASDASQSAVGFLQGAGGGRGYIQLEKDSSSVYFEIYSNVSRMPFFYPVLNHYHIDTFFLWNHLLLFHDRV